MSEANENKQNEVEEAVVEGSEKEDKGSSARKNVKLNGLYAYKVGMSSVYNENGVSTPVTVLKYEPMVVSQIKTLENDGYAAVQVASRPKKASNSSQAEVGHLKKSGFENGALLVKEIRQELPEGVAVGQKVSMEETLVKGDRVSLTSRSKGRGFAGVHKRWNFGGGPAAHGSGFHRAPGSIGNRTEPGRVMPGRKLPGHFGDETVTIKNIEIVDVLPEENVLLVKGAVPGARNTLVKLMKV